MATRVKLSCKLGTCPTNQSAQNDLSEMPMLDYDRTVDKMPNNSSDTFDGYTFKTDWNGSTNYMRTNNGNPFSTSKDNGLRFYTSSTIGKDRRLYYQWWNRSDNLFLPNVIGFTGSWANTNRQYHPRLDMVVFHYCDKSGNRSYDYKVDYALRGHNESSHYWNYGNTGQHDSGSQWWIGYALSTARRQTIFNGQNYLFGMSWDIKFRTAGLSDYADCRFWNFRPIIAENSTGTITLTSAANCNSGHRLVIPTRGNSYPVSSNVMRLT